MSRRPVSEADIDRLADKMAADTIALCERMAELLHGSHPVIVGGALAEVTARWVAAHFSEDAEATAQYREGVLEKHLRLIREMIPHSEAEILHNVRGESH